MQSFPATGSPYQVTQAGENGHHPLWSRDQKELFYVPLVGQFVARSITTQPTFSFGNPVPVPRRFPVAPPMTPRTFDITADNRIISIVTRRTSDSASSAESASMLAPSEVVVILNWFEELRTRVRTR